MMWWKTETIFWFELCSRELTVFNENHGRLKAQRWHSTNSWKFHRIKILIQTTMKVLFSILKCVMFRIFVGMHYDTFSQVINFISSPWIMQCNALCKWYIKFYYFIFSILLWLRIVCSAGHEFIVRVRACKHGLIKYLLDFTARKRVRRFRFLPLFCFGLVHMTKLLCALAREREREEEEYFLLLEIESWI